MKFDFIIGNPPYQGDNHQQIYPFFYLQGKKNGKSMCMIFPIGWQEPKNANNLRPLNNKEVKEDKQIVLIKNKKNVFPSAPGAEWTNIILWRKGFDNGLGGLQRIITDDGTEEVKRLLCSKDEIQKPKEFLMLYDIVKSSGDFRSISEITSVRKPYGLSTDVIKDTQKYGLEPLQQTRKENTDIKVYATRTVRYIPFDYNLPKVSKGKDKYKVFVPYAWGGMDEDKGFGGSYADIIIAEPNEICTETYLESGCFDTYDYAKRHSKYLMTKFTRALLYLNKYSRHSTTAWGAIPVQDYHEEWWSKSIAEIDKELMKKYNVPQDIQDFVFANIQERTEENIVNFR